MTASLPTGETDRHIPDVDEAIAFIIEKARETAAFVDDRGATSEPVPHGDNHFHMTIPQLLRSYFDWRDDPGTAEPAAIIAEPVFIEAAWELCLRGVIRPGAWHNTANADHNHCGYCLTRHGRSWLLRGKSRSVAF